MSATKDERNKYAELFTQYISDITLEVEEIKVRTDRNDIKGINRHVARINSSLLGIMDAKLDLAEKCNDINNISGITDRLSEHEILPIENMHDKKTEVGLAIKETLLELGQPTYEKVVEYLYREYHCFLTDCYEHPEYLKAVLTKIFGYAHMTIVESIKKRLEEFDGQKLVQEFLTVIAK